MRGTLQHHHSFLINFVLLLLYCYATVVIGSFNLWVLHLEFQLYLLFEKEGIGLRCRVTNDNWMKIIRLNFLIFENSGERKNHISKLPTWCHWWTRLSRIISSTNFNAQFNNTCMSHYYPRHVSGLDMPTLRRNNCTNTASGILALISGCTIHRLRAVCSQPV